ncbi:MAG: leucine--tRNA ligase [Bacteroidia bacterium]|nr:leucine--tRNA ligase [Bacteroidia bacterium]MDW8159012.1 leucine--tRNA ligase [Bacteroidia bacterium]
MGKYNFQEIEKKWQQYWKNNKTFQIDPSNDKPKYYILDMFPYPSGAGLHVGHPLGYIATDIIKRYKKLKGFNVLHPMGFDAFGLPAENYAIQTGTHPAVTTEKNIQRYQEQLELLGLIYTPNTDIRTCDPSYYRWTQWIFLQFFNSWYNQKNQKAEPITTLIQHLENYGTDNLEAATTNEKPLSAQEWRSLSYKEKEEFLSHYRLAYQSYAIVNWCPALGTVLANEEVKDGVSERGGHPVERIPMRQWFLRITAYAERLLQDLDLLDWPTSIIEMQKNWIGKSRGAIINFALQGHNEKLTIFTTRPDTIFGVTFMVLAPEHPLVPVLTTETQREEISAYLQKINARSERERLAETQKVSGAFTGAYAIHPFRGTLLPIYIADYVLMGYGTGAIMAVPAHDSRDYVFAQFFKLPIIPVIEGTDIEQGANENKEGTLINSDFLNGLNVTQAIERIINELERRKLGKSKITYRLRDAIFSRQRYWGEPFPIVFDGDTPIALSEKELPIVLPPVQSYKPTGTGESPLAALTDWVNLPDGKKRETNTMPGWAGSSWYFLRYLDPLNTDYFCSLEKQKYWMPVDLYIGGSEHAVGHLLYARFWTKFLYDLGHCTVQEPFKKLVNQGMIQGRSNIAYKLKDSNTFIPATQIEGKEVIPIHVDINLTYEDRLDIEAFKQWRPDYKDATFILENGEYICGVQIEKMSKSLHNVVNPDEICQKYGSDTFRLYEMFLGPLEQHKPWNTQGISGVANFLRKFYSLYLDDKDNLLITEEEPTFEEYKWLHQTIKKVSEDIERLSFNTAVPQFMIFTNEMHRLKCHKRAILEPILVVLAPFAPHLAEELWHRLDNSPSIFEASYPKWDPRYLEETHFEYPVSINGKLRAKLLLPLNLEKEEIEKAVITAPELQKYVQGQSIKKVIIVPQKIINLVI